MTVVMSGQSQVPAQWAMCRSSCCSVKCFLLTRPNGPQGGMTNVAWTRLYPKSSPQENDQPCRVLVYRNGRRLEWNSVRSGEASPTMVAWRWTGACGYSHRDHTPCARRRISADEIWIRRCTCPAAGEVYWTWLKGHNAHNGPPRMIYCTRKESRRILERGRELVIMQAAQGFGGMRRCCTC